VVVEAPGLGDEIQAGKAGILEIADILAVNKADQPGADHAVKVLQQMLELGANLGFEGFHHQPGIYPVTGVDQSSNRWLTPIIKTIAIKQDGISDLLNEINNHHSYLIECHGWEMKEKRRLKQEFDHYLQEAIIYRLQSEVSREKYNQVMQGMIEKKYSPHEAAMKLID
jgi:LAO/AO transport system kinase